jgi:GntR family transcriptional repressor for pyruvate dehydrogenase complex
MATDFKPVEKIKASEQVAENLLKFILQGGVEPGGKLPPERDLAARFNVTRTTLREALKKLEQMKLIAIRQGQGITVEDYRTASIDVLLYMLIVDGRIDLGILENILEARDLFGTEVARLAARRAGKDDLNQLDSLVGKMSGVREPAELQLLDFELFRLLALSGKNIVYILLMNMLKTIHEKNIHLFAPLSSDMDTAAQRAIVDAVKAGDEDLAGECAAKFLSIGTEFLKALKTV